MDEDGRADFKFIVRQTIEGEWNMTHFYITPLQENKVSFQTTREAKLYYAKDTITSAVKGTEDWKNEEAMLFEIKEKPGYYYTTGPWVPISGDHPELSDLTYTGISIHKNNTYFLGWIQVQHAVSGTEHSCIIKGIGLSGVSKISIKAGS